MCLSLCLSVSLPASLPLLLKCLQKVYLQRTLAVTAVSSPQLCSYVSDIKCPPPWHGYIQWFIISHNRLGLVTCLIVVVMFIVYLLCVKSAWKYKMVHMDSFNIFCNQFKIVFFFFFGHNPLYCRIVTSWWVCFCCWMSDFFVPCLLNPPALQT